MSNKKISLELLSCPGDTIQETLDYFGYDKRWLVQQLGVSGNQAWRLLKGKLRLNRALAGQLEEVFRVDKQFWINLEKNYRDKQKAIHRL